MTRYELLDRIGVGGMAEIFRGKAVAAGGFEKPVAIKRILPHLSQDRRFVQLLIAEAKVLSLLKHRNIVQIFDVGLGDDGKYFLVMEFVDGKDVGAVQRALELQRRRIPYDLVLHIGAEICEALDHAHNSRGPDGRPMSLVHRDVSPSNVILSRAGEVKLTDFGIAKRAEADVTHGGAVRGKFAYISPEQARNEHIDPRSDVFSVGILLWELLVNRRLFSGLPDLEALRGVREAQIPPPTQADSRLPKEIDSIVMTALARDKTRRYASAAELGGKLRSLRYKLEVTVGDPASEIARIVEATHETEGASQPPKPLLPSGSRDFDANEATVIRISTADAFSARDNDASLVAAREVIDRFEDEETRLAQLSGDQLRMLRSATPADLDARPRAGRTRSPSEDDEATRAHAPLRADELEASTPPRAGRDDVPHAHVPRAHVTPAHVTPAHVTPAHVTPAHVTPNDETRLVAPRDRRTPAPQRTGRPPTLRSSDDRARAAPLTLDEPGEPWSTAPTSAPTNQAFRRDEPPRAPLTLDGRDSLAAGSAVDGDERSMSQSEPRSVSQSASQSVSRSASQSVAHAPLTLESTPAGPPPPLKMPATPAPADVFTPPPPPPPMATPVAPPGSYPGWGPPIAAQRAPRDPTPSARDSLDRPPSYPAGRSSAPAVAGSQSHAGRSTGTFGFKPWMLVVGAVIVALAAFAITRAFIR